MRLLVPMRVLQSCIVTVAWDEITCPYEGFTELYCNSRWDEITCTYEWFCRDCIATVAGMR